jgi:hypothetical protein
MGQHVSAGDILGITGNTGHSTGPHLHVSLYNQVGTLVDPKPFIDSVTPEKSHGWLGTLWNIITKPGAELAYGPQTTTLGAFQQLLDPAATILALVLLFLTMLGSKRARKYLYWDIAGYIVLKLVITSI